MISLRAPVGAPTMKDFLAEAWPLCGWWRWSQPSKAAKSHARGSVCHALSTPCPIANRRHRRSGWLSGPSRPTCPGQFAGLIPVRRMDGRHRSRPAWGVQGKKMSRGTPQEMVCGSWLEVSGVKRPGWSAIWDGTAHAVWAESPGLSSNTLSVHGI